MKYLLGHDSSKNHFKLAPGFQTAYHETAAVNALIAAVRKPVHFLFSLRKHHWRGFF